MVIGMLKMALANWDNDEAANDVNNSDEPLEEWILRIANEGIPPKED